MFYSSRVGICLNPPGTSKREQGILGKEENRQGKDEELVLLTGALGLLPGFSSSELGGPRFSRQWLPALTGGEALPAAKGLDPKYI